MLPTRPPSADPRDRRAAPAADAPDPQGPGDSGDTGRPSKSARKREMHEVQRLGEQLVELTEAQLEGFDLPEAVREAIRFARTVRSHEGRRRHLQYLGRLMRAVEPGPVRAQLAMITGSSREAVARMHACERLRDRLLDDDGALTALLAGHPAADGQALRATIRAARRERDEGRAPRQARALYRSLFALLAAPEETPAGTHGPPETPQP